MNKRGEVLFAQKIIVSNNTATKSTIGLIRKSSTSVPPDYFHQTASILQYFTKNIQEIQESDKFLYFAKNYVLNGRTLSEMCDHNAAVAMDCGKASVSNFRTYPMFKIVIYILGKDMKCNLDILNLLFIDRESVEDYKNHVW